MRILYIGAIQLPDRDAASIRVYNIGYALRQSGHTVDYLCIEGHASAPIPWEDSTYHFVFAEEPSSTEKMRELLFGDRTAAKCREFCRGGRYDAVILYNTTSFIENRLLRVCRREGVRALADVTEWYEVKRPRNKKGLFPYVNALTVDRRIRRVDQRLDGVLAISRYLYDFYEKKGVNVLRIPPVFHYDRQYQDTDGTCKTILYAGSPAAGKDEIGILKDAVRALNREKICLRMVFVGVNIPDDAPELEQSGIFFRPRCNTEQVIEYVRASDFTVLFRHNKRYAKAGYSTKVAESLFNGVPVLCNAIGGTDTDIEDGINGVKIRELTPEAVRDALTRIAGLSPEENAALRRNCREIGDRLFNADHYTRALDAFLRGACAPRQ